MWPFKNNKYTHEKVYLSASEIIQKNLNNESNYNEYEYSNYYYQPVSSKLYRIKNLHINGWYDWLIFDEGFYVFMIFLWFRVKFNVKINLQYIVPSYL
mgnify:CR=1 FL=1